LKSRRHWQVSPDPRSLNLQASKNAFHQHPDLVFPTLVSAMKQVEMPDLIAETGHHFAPVKASARKCSGAAA
jgi:hypothetical protein